MGFVSYYEDITSRIETIDEIVREYGNLNSKPEGLSEQNKRLQQGMNKLKKEIETLQSIIERTKKEKAERGFLLYKELSKNKSLSKEIEFESDLRKTQAEEGLNWSELVFDFKGIFETMNEITKLNAWYKDRAKTKQLESLVETGLRKTKT
ncbi:MAG: hypothetical protein KIT62_17510 [Cyclobacteriaceae bacterium]|nr:hypothetical protein [Cyclobacteriaceae bacterium]